ncbi:MAG: hypothetical protein GWN00_25875 [Aliifodinibius sp.]|nr:hypothetical protein [Fodinibius sp.]NIX00437.1 hypothetical protein [Phycisphaerae bacterium]NIY28104.1 hypothetical protein [Fodinibius sp.]
MSNAYNYLSKIVRALSSRRIRQWWVIVTLIVGLALIGAVVIQIVTSGQTVLADLGKVSGLEPAGSSTQVKSNRLYIVSEIPRSDGFVGIVGGRVTVLDLETRREIYSINTGVDVHTSLSLDGTRLYIAAVEIDANCSQGEDHLFAVDAQNGNEIWRISIKDRVKYSTGGLSTLALSPEGRWLYLYSYPWCNLHYNSDGQVPYWLQIVDTTTGQVLPETIPLPGCGGATFTFTPTVGDLYVTCFESNDVRFINLQTRQVEQQLSVPNAPDVLGFPGGIAGSVLSSDGHQSYIVTDNFKVVVVDIAQRTITSQVDLAPQIGGDQPTVSYGLVALSDDGTKLIIGENLQEIPGTDTATELYIFDTNSWQKTGRLRVEKPLGQETLILGPNQRSVYGISSSFSDKPLPFADTILNVSLTDEQAKAPLVRKGEVITHIFIGW